MVHERPLVCLELTHVTTGALFYYRQLHEVNASIYIIYSPLLLKFARTYMFLNFKNYPVESNIFSRKIKIYEI